MRDFLKPTSLIDAVTRALLTVEIVVISFMVVVATALGQSQSIQSPEVNNYRIDQLEKMVVDLQAAKSWIVGLLISNLAGLVIVLFMHIARERRRTRREGDNGNNGN